MTRKSRHRGHRRPLSRRTPPGAAPGTLIVDPEAPHPNITAIAYGPNDITEQAVKDVQELSRYLQRWPVTWINVEGLGDAATIGRLGELFGLHRLALEDVINVHQRAKVEHYSHYDFIVARLAAVEQQLETEQVSIFLGKNYILTFQEKAGNCFDPVRGRIRGASGRFRSLGPDYLAYALLDAIIDNYFPVMESYGERLEMLEDEVVSQPDKHLVTSMHEVKRDLLTLRRAVWPLREAIHSLAREATPLISDDTRIYMRDCYDHVIQIIDLLENYRDIASSLLDVYLSSISNRLNEVMKILTMFTALFIPMSLIAGIYGMNFNPAKSAWNMPELNWAWGYPFALGLMLAIAVVLLLFFRRKGWL